MSPSYGGKSSTGSDRSANSTRSPRPAVCNALYNVRIDTATSLSVENESHLALTWADLSAYSGSVAHQSRKASIQSPSVAW